MTARCAVRFARHIVAAKNTTKAMTAAMGIKTPAQSFGASRLAFNIGLMPGKTISNTSNAKPPTINCSQSSTVVDR